MEKCSLTELEDYFEQCTETGQLAKSTAYHYVRIITRVLEGAGAPADADLRSVDQESTFDLFVRKSGQGACVASLSQYRSQFRFGMQRFLGSVSGTTDSDEAAADRAGCVEQPAESIGPVQQDSPSLESQDDGGDIPEPVGRLKERSFTVYVPLADDITVVIEGLPRELSTKHVRKIVGILEGFAILDEPSERSRSVAPSKGPESQGEGVEQPSTTGIDA